MLLTTPESRPGVAWMATFDLAPALLIAMASLLFERPLPAALPVAICGGILTERWAVHSESEPAAIKAGLPATAALLKGVGARRWVQLQPHGSALPRLSAEEVQADMAGAWPEGQVAVAQGSDVMDMLKAVWGL